METNQQEEHSFEIETSTGWRTYRCVPADAIEAAARDLGAERQPDGRWRYHDTGMSSDWLATDGDLAVLGAGLLAGNDIGALYSLWCSAHPGEQIDDGEDVPFVVGDRVQGGSTRDDFDVGRVCAIQGTQVTVAWDSGQTTTQHFSLLDHEDDDE